MKNFSTAHPTVIAFMVKDIALNCTFSIVSLARHINLWFMKKSAIEYQRDCFQSLLQFIDLLALESRMCQGQ